MNGWRVTCHKPPIVDIRVAFGSATGAPFALVGTRAATHADVVPDTPMGAQPPPGRRRDSGQRERHNWTARPANGVPSASRRPTRTPCIEWPVLLTAPVTSSEDPAKDGAGRTVPDWTEPVVSQATGQILVQLRAERAGSGPGRTYTIAIRASDAAANSSTAVVVVKAPHCRTIRAAERGHCCSSLATGELADAADAPLRTCPTCLLHRLRTSAVSVAAEVTGRERVA